MTHKDKRALADALRQAAYNLMGAVQENPDCGYYEDIKHIPSEEMEKQINKWLDKLPF